MSATMGTIKSDVRAFSATSGPGLLRGIEAIASWHRYKILAMFDLKTIFQMEQFLEEIDSVEYGGE
jgi:pyruvate ferredoxin oxidoreductase alpha subunit